MDEHLHAVIMAGGRGTRFWPLSTGKRPKQLLPIMSARTMIQETAERVAPLVPPERLWVVTGAEQAVEVARQLPALPPAQLLVEPAGRNTAPAVGLAATHIVARDPTAVMAVLPADHAIGKVDAFRTAFSAAARAAAQHPVLITLGITPSRPETGYGYIEYGEKADTVSQLTFYEVAAFREKPDRRTAERYLADRRHAWNAGVFIWQAAVIREEIAVYLPALDRELRSPALVSGSSEAATALAAAYGRIEAISIDYGVLERSRRIWVLPVDCEWNDVGSWAALYDVRPRDAADNVVIGDAVIVESRNTLVHAEDAPLVALVGIEDAVVISTPGAVLVCARDKVQEVRKVVDELELRGRKDLL